MDERRAGAAAHDLRTAFVHGKGGLRHGRIEEIARGDGTEIDRLDRSRGDEIVEGLARIERGLDRVRVRLGRKHLLPHVAPFSGGALLLIGRGDILVGHRRGIGKHTR